jgi:hypothetical protein
MNTHNIVSTPNITGNVGSCTSQIASIKTYGDWWSETRQDYLTNSCTGEITIGVEYWSMGFFIPTIFITVISAFTIFLTIKD